MAFIVLKTKIFAGGHSIKAVLTTFIFLIFSAQIQANSQLVFSTAEDSPIQELSIQVLTEAYAELGYTLKILRMPNARSQLYANSGHIDGEVSRIEGLDKELKNLLRIPVEINAIYGHVFSKNPNIQIADWEDLRAYTVICVKGSKFVERQLAARKIECHSVSQFAQAMHLLQAERGDLAVLPKLNGLQTITQEGYFEIKMSKKPLETAPLYHYLHQKNRALAPKIEAILRRMHASGRLTEIRAKYHQHIESLYSHQFHDDSRSHVEPSKN